MRNALAYVLLNARKHWKERYGTAAPARLDEASSGRWFDGWRRGVGAPAERDPPEVSAARTWLLAEGWRRHGLIGLADVPGVRHR